MKKMNYLIEIPDSRNGIYIIINLVEWKAYVGLAQNMLVRAKEHFVAICGTGLIDNSNLLAEENKQFLHFVIEQYNDKLKLEDLQDIECEYIYMMREVFKFKLYNISKSDIQLSAIKTYDEKRYKERFDGFKNRFYQQTGYKIDGFVEENRGDIRKKYREEIWKNIIDKYDDTSTNTGKMRYRLETDEHTFSMCDNYKSVFKRLDVI